MNTNTMYMQNRELSWLRFNERVLEEAVGDHVPTFEKLKFISIFVSNLDEFFMIRVGSLTDLCLLKTPTIDNKTGMTAQEQLQAIYENMPSLYAKKDRYFYQVEEELRKEGIRNLRMEELSKEQAKVVHDFFVNYATPVLSPQIVDVHHPFPFLENKMLYIFLQLKSKNEIHYGLIPVNKNVPLFIQLPGEEGETNYVTTGSIIRHYADKIFKNYEVVTRNLICVTRNADLSADDEIADEDVDYRSHMKKILKKRMRLAPVRMEIAEPLDSNAEKFLLTNLKLNKNQVILTKAPINMKYIFSLPGLIKPEKLSKLTYESFSSQPTPKLDVSTNLLDQIRKKDVMLSYPYEDMDTFIQLINHAADDPRVISIKITIYRLASNSHLVKHLIRAAENGKDVTVLMELRARFDEQSNINYSEMLYESGCNIIYGFENYKVHSKLCLITYKDGNQIHYITQIGTGNYNESTSKLYADLSMMTGNKEIGSDAAEFFKNMSLGNLHGHYKHLLQAPSTLKKELMRALEEEIKKGPEGQAILKMNSLTDKDFIDKFMEASQKGVRITLIIRGICCILPGVPGLTDNVEVRAIVGRYLEHARIYSFGKGDDYRVFISSADMMTRNTERRVEIAVPVYDEGLKNYLKEYLKIQLKDTFKGRIMNEKGEYEKIPTDEAPFSSQQYFMDQAIANAKLAHVVESEKKRPTFKVWFEKIMKK